LGALPLSQKFALVEADAGGLSWQGSYGACSVRKLASGRDGRRQGESLPKRPACQACGGAALRCVASCALRNCQLRAANCSPCSRAQNQGIQKLLQAESEAAEAIRIAREAKVVRLKQAKAEAEVEIAAYKAQREEQFQALAKLRTGDSGTHQKAVAVETEKELASVAAKVAANKGAMIDSLLKSVTTVGN